MPTIGLVAEGLGGGTTFQKNRSSANRIFSVMSGKGISVVDGRAFEWEFGDTFVVPSSYWLQHKALEDAVLLEMSDEPLMRFANHYFTQAE
jgi:gentisate 1,2-dioxygenase